MRRNLSSDRHNHHSDETANDRDRESSDDDLIPFGESKDYSGSLSRWNRTSSVRIGKSKVPMSAMKFVRHTPGWAVIIVFGVLLLLMLVSWLFRQLGVLFS